MEETEQYISTRLRIAGADSRPVFTQDAIEAVHAHSRGIPRVINLLCEHGLVGAYAEQKRPVPVETIQEVASEFKLDVIETSPPAESDESMRLMEAIQTLATFMDKLRRPR